VDAYRSLAALSRTSPTPRFTLACERECIAGGLDASRPGLVVDGLAVGEIVIVSSLVATNGGVVALAWGMTVE